MHAKVISCLESEKKKAMLRPPPCVLVLFDIVYVATKAAEQFMHSERKGGIISTVFMPPPKFYK